MVYFLADGNEKIGMGHVQRCLSIAEGIRRREGKVSFLSHGSAPRAVVEARGFSFISLDGNYERPEDSLPGLIDLLTTGSEVKPVLLLDSYFIDEAYTKALMDKAFVVLLDDNGERVIPCHMLINYNIYGRDIPYKQMYGEARPLLLLGSLYAPLRQSFLKKAEDLAYRENVRHILVTTGGGDGCHVLLSLAKRLLLEKSNYTWHLVCGPFCPDTEQIRALAESAGDMLVIHENVTDMSELFLSCDICISAAGSTLYELCAMGVPAACFTVAANQHKNAESFAHFTGMRNIGDFEKEPKETLLHLIEEAQRLMAFSTKEREALGVQMKAYADGLGAERIAGKIIACVGELVCRV